MVILITGCGDCTWMILVNFVTALAFRCVLMLSCDLRILSLHPPPYCMVSVPEWLKSLSIGPTGEPNAIVFCTVGHTWPGARFSIEVPITFWAWKAVLCLIVGFKFKIKVSIILKMRKWKYKLIGLWARKCATFEQVLISKSAFGPKKLPGLL